MKKKKLILWILTGVVATVLLAAAVLYVVYLVKYRYPDYVSAWRQDSQTTDASFPLEMELFRNGTCTIDGAQTNYKIKNNTLSIGETTYEIVYDLDHMTLTDASGSASYESTGSSERYDYHIKNGGAVIERYNGYQQTLVVPDTLGGVPVTTIDSIHYHRLVNLTIPDSVTSIGPYAFWYCTSLEETVLSQSLLEIPDRSFEGCLALTQISIPNGVVSIGDHAFSECTALESVVLPESLESIGESAFAYCAALPSLSLPVGLTSIADAAFENCDALISVALPSGLTSIGANAFWGCTSLEKITLPDSLISLGMSAFSGCTSLESVGLSRGLTALSGYTFQNCSSLRNITIPYGITSLWLEEFSGCTALETVEIPQTVTDISSDAFIGCTNLTALTIASGNPAYISRDNALLSADGKTLCFYFDGSRNSAYTIPQGVETIASNAFFGCTHLQQVIIPEGVIEIEYAAFKDCLALQSLSFPASVEKCSYAVEECYALNDVTISPQNQTYSISDGLLLSKDGLSLYNCFYGAVDGTLKLPEGIAQIFGNPYENIADLQSVWLPGSLIDIGMEHGNTALGDESYLAQNNITVYAWKDSDAYKAAKKNEIDVIAREN